MYMCYIVVAMTHATCPHLAMIDANFDVRHCLVQQWADCEYFNVPLVLPGSGTVLAQKTWIQTTPLRT